MKKTFLLLIILFSGYTFTSSKNYIAAVTGTSSGTGTLASPYDVLTAISKAAVGDTVYIRGGQYMMASMINLNKGGSATGYINIWAYPGDSRPILDFFNRGYSGTNSSSERGIQISKPYYNLVGLDISRAGDNGMNISSSYAIIRNCRFYKNCDGGLQITGSSLTEGNNQIIDCDSYDNYDYKTAGGAGGNADGFSCKLTVGPGNKFIRCRSWDNSDDGYDCYGSQNDIYFEDCWVMTNGQKSYDVSTYPSWPAGTYGVGVVINTGNGNGFKVGGNGAVGGATLIRCISYGHNIMSSSNKGFDQNNSVGRVICSNCISYNDGRGYSFPNNSDARGPHVFSNNIVICANNNNTFPSNSALITYNTNSWNGIPASASDFISVALDNAKVERNADGSLPYFGGLFRLISSSGLIDKGTNVGLPFIGIAPDLGAYEYNPGLTAIPEVQASDISVTYSAANNQLLIQGPLSFVEVYRINGVRIFSQQVHSDAISIPSSKIAKGICLVHVLAQNGEALTRKILVD